MIASTTLFICPAYVSTHVYVVNASTIYCCSTVLQEITSFDYWMLENTMVS